MKKFMSYLMYGSLLLVALNFTSCQEEFEELPGEDNQEAILASSSTGQLIQRTSSKDGSYDNIVDGASCFAINFPYVVNVHGLEVEIDAIEDLKLIKQLFDEVEIDDDIVDIVFPITITLSDYTEIKINNREELRERAKECLEGGDDDDIECIDFVYPIVVYSFDINLQQTGNVTVQNDMQLRRYFAERGDDDLLSFDFPITLELYDDTKISVSNNAELAHAIETAKNACDEDDDNDYHDNDFTQERLEEYLVACPWLVREVFRANLDNTDQYFDYVMNFTEDGKVVMKDRIGNSLTGTWITRIAEHRVLLKLEFEALADFSLEWFVYDLDNGKIKLYAGEGERIIMKKACDIVDNTPDTLREILKECSWVIKKVKLNNEEVDRLLGYEFNFHAEGVVTLSNESNISEGQWAITTNAQGRLVMAITMGDEPGVSFEWLLSDLRDKRLKFSIEDDNYELILERVCDNNANDGDVAEIRNILMGGQWMVAKYTEGEKDETQNYAAFTFAFQAELAVNVTTGETGPTYPGLWRIIRDSEGELKCYLNFGLATAMQVLMDDWKIVSVTSSRIELKNISGDNTTEILVFEKK
ncbi:hypothetical protein H4O18_05875 [Arenibacter sp. BSSL-BM3]|uniref:Lipocalin-like domain-containing protein n=1 Tax=Arenibacter arenosicollis TaxID=2762274 RepID=A0ABR7QK22_9FLAO|nr:hypothetical protein [Arenibacter arenosicollis]MBC8767514.1 hypothetical protein [Arenibacter arenosicollis]